MAYYPYFSCNTHRYSLIIYLVIISFDPYNNLWDGREMKEEAKKLELTVVNTRHYGRDRYF